MASLLAQLAADGLLNEDAASLLDGEDGVDRRTVVIVGVTGDGKSSTGNTLCGSDVFCVGGGFRSVTQECAHADYLRRGTFWRVIDTVGLHDTDLPHQVVMDRFSAFADQTPDGIDAFLFVVKWGRFKPEHDAALSAFVANCGDAALRHSILVLTHCRETPDSLRGKLEAEAPESLRSWLPRFQDVVGIENMLGGTAANASPTASEVLHAALQKLLLTNGGARYTNEALAEARSRCQVAEQAEQAAFQAAVAEWRRGSGPVRIERDPGVTTRPAGSWAQASLPDAA